MKCPKCNAEMLDGKMETSSVIVFNPKDPNLLSDDDCSTWSLIMLKNVVKIGNSSPFTTTKVSSYYCKNCKFIMTPIKK